MEKTESEKSRDTVPLTCICNHTAVLYVLVLYCIYKTALLNYGKFHDTYIKFK
jgi:hypothetical protein